MSFDFSPNVNLSNVQASSKTTDGGGGNTGYFQRRKGDEDEKLLEFAKDYPSDSFEKVEIMENIDETNLIDLIKEFFLSILNTIKNLFKPDKK